MRSFTISIFAVTSALVALAIAKPVPKWNADGMAIPLTRYSSSLDLNTRMDLDSISSHAISVREKILNGLDNYEINTGKMHPFALKRWNELGLKTRAASIPLTSYVYSMWMTEISIGTPSKNWKVLIDTGAADMWMLQNGCSGIASWRHLWNPSSSGSAKTEGQPFKIDYRDGTMVKGDIYTDNVTIAGFTADPQTFGSVTSYISPLPNHGFADGLLGLAFPSISTFGAYPLFTSLARTGKLTNNPAFSLKLSSSGAEMYIGGANRMLYNGDIAYTPVTNPGMWQVSMDDVRVNGNPILKDVPVILDTGTSYIFGDQARVSELYKHLGGTLKAYKGFYFYYLPCDSFPTLSFTFGGRPFEIPPEVLRLHPIEAGSSNCFSAIIADKSPTASFWNIGVAFLQGVYSVFDYTTLRVGFTELA